MPPDELVRWRGEVLDQLATQIGLTGPDARDEVRARLEGIDPSAWVGPGQAPATPSAKPQTPPKSEKPTTAPKAPKPVRERPSRRLLGLLALLVVLVIVVAAVSLTGDDDSGDTTPAPPTTSPTSTTTEPTTTTKPTTTTEPTTTTPPSTPPIELAPLPGMPDRGSATVTVSTSGDERTIEVELQGMPAPGGGAGVYELWLYNTLIGARPLGTTDSGDGSITAPLPADADEFRYLDLSREDGPTDRVHSGVSIRRAELAPLLTPTE